MFRTIKTRLDRAWFNLRCAGIYGTRPVECDPSSEVVIVSQLHPPDLVMYMLAAKSFARYLIPKKFVVVDDGLLEEDKRILSDHFSPIRFIPRKEVSLGLCPAGGCWERLLTMSKENRDHYVIQLDSDTLTLAEPTEVLCSVTQGQTFTLGTSSGTHFVSFSKASQFAHDHACEHVQNHAERALGRYPSSEHLQYVRGCAGFTGFAKGRLAREKIEEFSIQMEHLIGRERWCQWGAEQVTSNCMVANAPNSLVLPVGRYPFWGPGVDAEHASMIHFFGTFRFSQGVYLRQASRLIKQLSE